MISHTVDYALRAIVYLADHPGEAHTTEKIAAATKVPVGYLAKIMHGLVRSRLVASQRGLHGGFTLQRDPKELTVYEVVQAVDPLPRIDRCPLQIEDHGGELCPLHRLVDEAMARVEELFRRTSIEALIREPGANRPLCSCPRRRSP